MCSNVGYVPEIPQDCQILVQDNLSLEVESDNTSVSSDASSSSDSSRFDFDNMGTSLIRFSDEAQNRIRQVLEWIFSHKLIISFSISGLCFFIILSMVVSFEINISDHEAFSNQVFVNELSQVLHDCYLNLKRRRLDKFVSNLPIALKIILKSLIEGHCPDLVDDNMTFSDAEQCLQRYDN